MSTVKGTQDGIPFIIAITEMPLSFAEFIARWIPALHEVAVPMATAIHDNGLWTELAFVVVGQDHDQAEELVSMALDAFETRLIAFSEGR